MYDTYKWIRQGTYYHRLKEDTQISHTNKYYSKDLTNFRASKEES